MSATQENCKNLNIMPSYNKEAFLLSTFSLAEAQFLEHFGIHIR